MAIVECYLIASEVFILMLLDNPLSWQRAKNLCLKAKCAMQFSKLILNGMNCSWKVRWVSWLPIALTPALGMCGQVF